MHLHRENRRQLRSFNIQLFALLRSSVFGSIIATINMLAVANHAYAGTQKPAPFSGNAQPIIKAFLLSQAAGLSGKIVIAVDTPMSGALPPCDAPEPFLPSGAKVWGRVSVGIRCNGAAPVAATSINTPIPQAQQAQQAWTRYVPAYVAVITNYVVATRPINAGETLRAGDFSLHEGDLTTLPPNILTNVDQINGMVALNRIGLGAPVRPELLRGVVIIQSGQNVKVTAAGTGFVASTEGRAMTSAAIGSRLQVKTVGGQMVSGKVRADGSVDLLY